MTQPYVSIDDLYNIVSLSGPRFSPGGQRLAYVRTEMDRETNGYKSAIWMAHLEGDDTHLRPFTSGEKRDSAPCFSPDGRWLAFVSDRGDDKAKPQIYLMPTDGGEARRLTRMENGAGEPAWSPDGTHLAFTARLNAEEMAREEASQDEPEVPLDADEVKRRAEDRQRAEEEKADPRVIQRFAYRAGTTYYDDRTAHLYLLELDVETGVARGRPRRITQDGRNYTTPRWLPDGSALVASVDRQPGQDDFFAYPDLVLVPVDGGEPHILTGPETADHNPWPSPDGRWIAYNSLPGDVMSIANAEVKLVPVAGGEPRVLTTDLDAHARDFRWSPDGKSIYFLVDEHGLVDLRRLSLDGSPIETILGGEREILDYDLSPDGEQVGFVANTDRDPFDLYLAGLASGAEQRLTEVNAGWLSTRTLADIEDLWFEAPDGTPIQGWIIKPPDFDPETTYPLVLSIHGGPHAMWSRHEPTMWHEWQVLAATGYVVFASNPRGSDGYGQDFRAAALNRWGEADLPDLLAGLEQVLARGYVDPERLVVTGGSYGGFMTAWIVGHEDRFKAAVAQRGVYDLVSFYSTTDIPRFAEREFGAIPWEDPALMWKYSPLAYVEDVHTPLLILHSENDYRAPIPAAEGLFVALRRLGREVEFVRYPRDGHELSRSGEPKHRVDRLQRIVAWFDKYVK
jgi:dipeptidyl aminopeptidase/acylaminoacyl peptidase